MPDSHEAAVQTIADAITRHLAAHPDAADTLEGIRGWWVDASLAGEPTARFVEALARLVERGVLRLQLRPDGTSYFAAAEGRPETPGSVAMLHPGVYVEEVPLDDGTLEEADRLVARWREHPTQRLTSELAASLTQITRWVVFEPDGERLWARIRATVGAFMHRLFRQGALPGRRPDEAYFVKCGLDTMTQADIDNGRVIVLVGFAPVKPAEFVVVRIQCLTGDRRG